MTAKNIFHQYYKKKLLIWGGIGTVAMLIRKLSGHDTSFAFAAIFIVFLLTVAVALGYTDYYFYERSAPKIIAQLIDSEPLAGFQKLGFLKEENNKLDGQINSYKIILSPITNQDSEKWLVILIPLQIREGLDAYFTKYNDVFSFRLLDQTVFAEAVIKNYEKEYDYTKLYNLIADTTLSLRKNDIEPVEIIEEFDSD